jgi:two-component system cell cycle response regulator
MRVLIADDEATSRLVLKAMATKLGHECLVASDGSTAWELLAEGGIDVLLTDWMMPGMDGLELCRRVRDEPGLPYVYVVLVTALGDHDKVLEGMGAGADDYLVKPVDAFAVRTRLVAAERVTALHRQLVEVQYQLELATAAATERSLTDELTGLGNRRRMEIDLADAHARALRVQRPYGVVMFDIDHFKAYNDHYGHLAGDKILRRVAHRLLSASRAGEQVYRFGGEEFLLVLTDTTVEGAMTAAERLREAIVDLDAPHGVRETSPSVVTLSGGVAWWDPQSSMSSTDVLQAADEALFAAKSEGRNRIVMSSTFGDPWSLQSFTALAAQGTEKRTQLPTTLGGRRTHMQ